MKQSTKTNGEANKGEALASSLRPIDNLMTCYGLFVQPGDPARGPQLQDLPAGGQDEAAGGAPGLEDAAGERPAARRAVPRRRVPGLERGAHRLLPNVQVPPQLRRLLRLRHRRPRPEQAARAGVVRPCPVARRGPRADPLRPLRVPAVGPPPRPRRLRGGGGCARGPQLAQELLHVREVRQGPDAAPQGRRQQRQIRRHSLRHAC
jgi:hypothetical protein